MEQEVWAETRIVRRDKDFFGSLATIRCGGLKVVRSAILSAVFHSDGVCGNSAYWNETALGRARLQRFNSVTIADSRNGGLTCKLCCNCGLFHRFTLGDFCRCGGVGVISRFNLTPATLTQPSAKNGQHSVRMTAVSPCLSVAAVYSASKVSLSALQIRCDRFCRCCAVSVFFSVSLIYGG